MGRSIISVLALAAMVLSIVPLCLCEISILADPRIEIHPKALENGLRNILFLSCAVEPNTLDPNNDYISQWTLPSGRVLDSTSPASSNPNEKHLLTQSLYTFGQALLPATLLIIRQPEYQDAGNYTCEAQNATDNTSSWVSDSVSLTLLVSVTTNEKTVMTFDNETSVELSCEMSDYIRPNDQFQWFGPDNQRIDSGVTYSTGAIQTTPSGMNHTIRTQISTLTIANPESSHSGNYTCRVLGTDEQSAVVELLVMETSPTTTTGTQTGEPVSTSTTDTATSPAASQFPLPPVIGAIAACLGIIVLVLVIIIVVVSMRKRKGTSVTLISNDFHENVAYASANNGGASNGSRAKYAHVNKSISPPPPLPARPPTNLSLSVGNSINSVSVEREPPGYETPDITFSNEKSGNYDPYNTYENPDEIKPLPPPPPKNAARFPLHAGLPRTHYEYDEVDVIDNELKPYDMSTVPSPAAVLSGSLPRNVLEQRNPDFNYPIYNSALGTDDYTTERDYDQIYSEPLDPANMLRNEYDPEVGNNEPLPYSAIYEDPQPLQDGIAPLKVTNDNIIEVRKLGTGQFGHVILAKTQGISMKDMNLSDTDNDRNRSILVAIKKLKLDAESCLMEAFDKEVKFMSRLNHDNVIRLLGVCAGTESFIMMEYMENGDLNQFLQKQSLMPDTISGLQENEVTPIILLYMGVQIASGMHYLASHRFVHRDLATRNCLVGKDFVVKISDFGMSRSLYESAYYRVQGTLVLPIRWMACETFYGKFSVKSDAWAFGVGLWEIYTLGKIDPYDNMTDEEVIADAIRGPDRRLPVKSEACPQDVYDIMLRCWVHEPSMRADFGEIYSRLFMIYTRQAL